MLLLLALLAGAAHAHDAQHNERLPTIGPAPDFALTSQDGARVSLSDFRGKAVAIAFIYTSCTDVCPMHVRPSESIGYLKRQAIGRLLAIRQMRGSGFPSTVSGLTIGSSLASRSRMRATISS